MKEKTKRNSSIELLRIISMIGVVILHYNNASMGGALGMVLDGSPNQYYLYLIESLFVCGVCQKHSHFFHPDFDSSHFEFDSYWDCWVGNFSVDFLGR